MRLRLPVILVFFSLSGFAQSLDFSIWVAGPRSVARGRMAILAAGASNITGSASKAQASISNLPPQSRGYIVENVTRYPNSANIVLTAVWGIKVVTTSNTPVGLYNLTFTVLATAANGAQVQRISNIPFEVRQPAGPLTKKPFPPAAPLPAIQQWEANMLKYGKKHVASNNIGCCSAFTGTWYYDGARAYLQMADYTGDASFLDFAGRINKAYRDNIVIGKDKRKYAVFPHGLRQFYLRYGDAQSREALKELQKDPGFGYHLQWGAPWSSSREMAYALSVHVVAESVGLPRRQETSLGFEPGESLFDEHLAIVVGQFEQWFVSETAEYIFPFMVGLSAEALIDYYEVSNDAEIPWLLKLAAEKMYSNDVKGPITWDEATASFFMNDKVAATGEIIHGPAPDLNLMLAPLYGWLFKQTGDVKYREIGDRVFTSGVQRGYLDGGKQFTQNYRWSFKYLEWRNSQPQGSTPPVPPSLLKAVTQ